MSDRPLSGLYEPRPRAAVVADLVQRARNDLTTMTPQGRVAVLEDAVYHERKRLERHPAQPGEAERVSAAARAVIRGSDDDRIAAALALTAAWADEVHGQFDPRAYGFASSVFPRGLGALLTGRPSRLRKWNTDPTSRVHVEGPIDVLRDLAREATIVLVPTHVSNLDSPLIGMSLILAGLPPFQYGAGLNLFSNPVMAWWMRRLGAYTVDRTKHSRLYKGVLKDYSIVQLSHRHHSLFFPGGTRSRSGALETRLKKGLLGTGVVAWQDMIEAGRPDPDVYIVPLTLSFQLVLEANTLIDDHLADAGRQRYIITDDEFMQPSRVASFVQRVLRLDASVVCRFGTPIDCVGRPVSLDAGERVEQSRRRRAYVTDSHGVVQRDPQRDRVYTDNVADAVVAAYPRDATVMNTHFAAWVGWRLLEQMLETKDPFRIVRTSLEQREIPLETFMKSLETAIARVRAGAHVGRWHHSLAATPGQVLQQAVDTFGIYHRSRALSRRGQHVVVEDPRLCLYYRNRVTFAGLEA